MKRPNSQDIQTLPEFQGGMMQMNPSRMQNIQQPQITQQLLPQSLQSSYLIKEDCKIELNGEKSKIDFLSFEDEKSIVSFPTFGELSQGTNLPAQNLQYLQQQLSMGGIVILRGWVFFNEREFIKVFEQFTPTNQVLQFQSNVSELCVFVHLIRFQDVKEFQNGGLYPTDLLIEDQDMNNKIAFIACRPNDPQSNLIPYQKLSIIHTFKIVPSAKGQTKIGSFSDETTEYEQQLQQQPNQQQQLLQQQQPQQNQQQQQYPQPQIQFDLFNQLVKNHEENNKQNEELKKQQLEQQKIKVMESQEHWFQILEQYEDTEIPKEDFAQMITQARFYLVRTYNAANREISQALEQLPINNQTFTSFSKHIQQNPLILVFLFQFSSQQVFESIEGLLIFKKIQHSEEDAAQYNISPDNTTWEQTPGVRTLDKVVPVKWLKKGSLKQDQIGHLKNQKNKAFIHQQYEGNELDQATSQVIINMFDNPPASRSINQQPFQYQKPQGINNTVLMQQQQNNMIKNELQVNLNNLIQNNPMLILNPALQQQIQMINIQLQQQLDQSQLMVLIQIYNQLQQAAAMAQQDPNMRNFQNIIKMQQKKQSLPQQRETPKEGDGEYVYRCQNFPKCQSIQGVDPEMVKQCENKRHPSKICKYFPKCLKGNKCVNLHPTDGKYYKVALCRFRKNNKVECPDGLFCASKAHCPNRHEKDKEYTDMDLRCYKFPECQEGKEEDEKCYLIHPYKKICLKYPNCDKRDYQCQNLHPSDGKHFKKVLSKSKENCNTICTKGERCKFEACLYLHPGEHRFRRVLKKERKRMGERCKFGSRCRQIKSCLYQHSDSDSD